MIKSRQTLFHTLIYMAGLIANRGVAFLLIPFYTHVLEPYLFAKLDLCTTTVIFLIPVFELAMGSALVRFYHYTELESDRKRIVASSFTFVILSVVFFSACLILLAEPVAIIVFGDGDNIELIYLIIITIAITALGNQVLALLRAQDKSIQFATLNLVRAVIGPIVIIYLVVARDMGLKGVLLGDIVGLSAMMAIGLVINRKWIYFRLSLNDLKIMIPFALPLVPWALATSVITLSDRYFLRVWVGYDELAVYSLGFKIGMIMTLFTRAFQTAWPSSAYQIAKDDDANNTFFDIFNKISVASIFLAFLLSVASPIVIPVITGHEIYGQSHIYVPLIAFSYTSYMLVLYVLTALTIYNNTKVVLYIVVLSCSMKILTSILLIYNFGSIGAAIATFITFLFELYVSCKIVHKLYGIHYDYFKYVYLLATSETLIYLYYYIASNNLVLLLFGSAFTIFMFAAVIQFMGFANLIFWLKKLYKSRLPVLTKIRK